jgi:diguanylate cyclase (GGDEF)-like protein
VSRVRVTPTAAHPILRNPLIVCCLAISAGAAGWFAAGPANGQVPVLRAVTPLLAGLAATGQWRISRDPRLPGTSTRFWRILALALSTFTVGMIVDLVALLRAGGSPQTYAGEIALYPIAALFALVALVAFPTVARSGVERVKIGLDVAIVLFGSATFVWYFLISARWRPSDGWWDAPRGTVLPALTLVAGFAVLRITSADTTVIRRATLACFSAAAVVEAATIVLDTPAVTAAGRLSSVLQTFGLAGCAVGVEIQRAGGPVRAAGTRRQRRRRFTVLPYGAVVATLVLLLMVVAHGLDYRGWVVVGSVLAVCSVVMIRQLVSLWENSRLLSANHVLAGQLRHQAFHDHLTGLANRSLFTERVTRSLARGRAAGGSVAVLFIDLDDFKVINDTLGHQTGDALLTAVARRLAGHVVPPDSLGRLGGDEFAILVEDAGGDRAHQVARDVIAALRQPLPLPGAPVRVGASVGIAVAQRGEPDTDDLLRNADVAMYTAKRADPGGYRVFDPTMFADLLDRHRMRAALANAVERAEFVVHYQPIVDLADGTLCGAEALVRWRGPAGELIAPGQFIPLAEEAGLITEIDRWVLREACGQVARWLAELPAGGTGFGLHVNLSARQLHRPDLALDVDRVLREHGIPPQRLTLEITESGLGHDRQAAVEQLRALAELGVHLAIDDFGTGYSSLSYLRHLPVDVLKIDKTFTDELRDVATGPPLAQAVIALAAALGMSTVAEGIEEPGQAGRLLALGCRYGQGFHYGEALPAGEMGAMLRSAPVPAG